MKIQTFFIINVMVFNDQQNSDFKKLFAEWVVVNQVNSRMLVYAIINDETFDIALTALQPWSPAVVGKWRQDGSKLIDTANLAEYISLLPPVLSVLDGNLVTTQRTEAVQVSGWSGWELVTF